MCETFTSAVAGKRHFHQGRVQTVLEVALQDAFFDQDCSGGRRAFVIDVERSSAVGQGAIVYDRAQLRGDLLAHQVTEGRHFLTIEVSFEAVTDRLVQESAWPAGAKYTRHGPCRCRNCVEP